MYESYNNAGGRIDLVSPSLSGKFRVSTPSLSGALRRIGGQLNGRLSYVGLVSGDVFVIVSPEVMWLTEDNGFSGEFEVRSNTDWNVE